MTKEDVIGLSAKLYRQLEDLEATLKEASRSIKIIMETAEYLPAEITDFEKEDE